MLFKQFWGLEGSAFYSLLANRTFIYKSFVLRKRNLIAGSWILQWVLWEYDYFSILFLFLTIFAVTSNWYSSDLYISK